MKGLFKLSALAWPLIINAWDSTSTLSFEDRAFISKKTALVFTAKKWGLIQGYTTRVCTGTCNRDALFSSASGSQTTTKNKGCFSKKPVPDPILVYGCVAWEFLLQLAPQVILMQVVHIFSEIAIYCRPAQGTGINVAMATANLHHLLLPAAWATTDFLGLFLLCKSKEPLWTAVFQYCENYSIESHKRNWLITVRSQIINYVTATSEHPPFNLLSWLLYRCQILSLDDCISLEEGVVPETHTVFQACHELGSSLLSIYSILVTRVLLVKSK